jgi:uncharacterized protein with PhoU and TrkA domain
VGVVAVKRGTQLFPNPEASFRLQIEDTLVVLGTRTQLETFESLACASPENKEN